MMKKHFIGFLLLGATFTALGQDALTYQKPPQVMADLLLAKPSPNVSISSKGDWMILSERDPYPSIEELAMPEYRLAGLRINPRNFSLSRQVFINNFKLKNNKSQKLLTIIGLPENLRASNPVWSPQESKFAFTHTSANRVDLYVVDLQTAKAQKINKKALNTVMGQNIFWVNEQTLLYTVAPQSAAMAPKAPLAPIGPNVQENLGKIAPSRTNQDMLRSAFDEKMFEFLATSQLVQNKAGLESPIASPAIYNSISLSPNTQYLMVKTVKKPFSYMTGVYGFPSTQKIINRQGKTVKVLAELPSAEGRPLGLDNVQNVARAFDWRNDMPATVIWVEALDSGLVKNKVPYRDVVFSLDAPFLGKAKELVKTVMRYSGISWGNVNFALLSESSRVTSRSKIYALNPENGQKDLLFDLKTNDAYRNPGNPISVKNQYNQYVVYTGKNNDQLLLNNTTGASAEGDRPFLATFDIASKQSEIVWRSPKGYFEYVQQIIDPVKLSFISRRESKTEVPNYFLKNLVLRIADQQLTHFNNPYKALEGVSKQKISYLRSDSVTLTGDLYLPKGYDKHKDGPLPVLIWAYPREYTNAASAAQVRGSEDKFTTLNYGSPIYYVTQGYAILDNAEMPIVAHKGKKPNDNFVEQLTLNAKAAINKLAEMGVGDSSRVAIGGHSYGAFMTANLLAHTNLFKAGIARSGAYNRTLTPFGFQNEARTYWQAPKLYYEMSPFSYADKIKTPLLLIHGELDDNQGTFPINSDRLFNAIKGHGGTSRLVFLPYEAHGYKAKENLLHLIWETNTWLDTYVKKAKK